MADKVVVTLWYPPWNQSFHDKHGATPIHVIFSAGTDSEGNRKGATIPIMGFVQPEDAKVTVEVFLCDETTVTPSEIPLADPQPTPCKPLQFTSGHDHFNWMTQCQGVPTHVQGDNPQKKHILLKIKGRKGIDESEEVTARFICIPKLKDVEPPPPKPKAAKRGYGPVVNVMYPTPSQNMSDFRPRMFNAGGTATPSQCTFSAWVKDNTGLVTSGTPVTPAPFPYQWSFQFNLPTQSLMPNPYTLTVTCTDSNGVVDVKTVTPLYLST